jgi:hypothetical protein
MQKKFNKLMSILLIASILLSLLVLPVSAQANITEITDEGGTPITSGVYGDVLYAKGDGVTAGVEVNLYWDAVKSWDGEKGLLTSEEANADGSFVIEFEVPEAVNGAHYLWIRDTSTGSVDRSDPFNVDATLDVSSKSGIPNDIITLEGYGFGEDVDITSIEFGGDSLTTSPATPSTDELGSWTASFNVPNKVYDVYDITAEDEDSNIATVEFTIGAAISLDKIEGPVGTVVEVEGRGFTEDGTVTTVSLGGVDCGVIDENDLDINQNGEFIFELIIPQMSDIEEYELMIEDSGALEVTADFEVEGLAEIELSPGFGTPGSTVGITGYNFSSISGMDVEVYVGGTKTGTFDTNSNGEFSGSFTIPAFDSGDYQVTARQDDYNIIVSRSFRIGIKVVILSVSEGPSGTRVALTGAGFSAGGEWEATFGSVKIFESENVLPGGSISDIFYVPTLEPGTYDVKVLDVDEDIEVETEFTITEKTSISFIPASAPAEYNLTIEGMYFAESEGQIEVEFKIFNSTDEWDMNVFMNDDPVKTGEDGDFTAWWIVPDDFSIGSYTVNATDEEGLYAQFIFNVVGKETTINPRKSIYYGGDTISFDLESTFEEEGSYIKIWDPDENLFWSTDELNTWVLVGLVHVSPYFSQTAGGNPMILNIDAPLGTWTFRWYDSADVELGSGEFVVDLKTTGEVDVLIEELADSVEDLQLQISELADDVALRLETELANIEKTAGEAKTAAEAAESQVSEIGDDAKASKESADAAKETAEEAKEAAEEAKNAVNNLTNLIYGSIIASAVAAIVALVSLIQINSKFSS